VNVEGVSVIAHHPPLTRVPKAEVCSHAMRGDYRPRRIRTRTVSAIAVSSAWRLTLVQSCSEQSRRSGGGPVSKRKTGL
jgi:hypothetical protein